MSGLDLEKLVVPFDSDRSLPTTQGWEVHRRVGLLLARGGVEGVNVGV